VVEDVEEVVEEEVEEEKEDKFTLSWVSLMNLLALSLPKASLL
jgi:hypothetical protein